MFWESVLDDVIVEALFVGRCYWSEAVDDALVEALFLGRYCGSQSLMMFCWRQFFEGAVARAGA